MAKDHTRLRRPVNSGVKTPKTGDVTAGIYFAEVGKHPLPTKAEERRLFGEYATAKSKAESGRSPRERAEGRRAREAIGQKLACGYLRFVIQQAGRKTSDPVLMKDLIGQGNIGLMVGIDKFDLAFGTRFLTYAASWIRVYMQDYLHKLNVVHLPSHTRKERKKREQTGGPTLADREEPTTVDCDDVTLVSAEDVGEAVSRREFGSLQILDTPGLTAVEKFVLIYAFGMRGVELSNSRLAMMLYELGLGAHTAKGLNTVRTEALDKVRRAFASRGVAALADIL